MSEPTERLGTCDIRHWINGAAPDGPHTEGRHKGIECINWKPLDDYTQGIIDGRYF